MDLNIVSMVTLTLTQRMGTERTHSLHLCFVTIASIIFENADANVNAKCEWALMLRCLPGV